MDVGQRRELYDLDFQRAHAHWDGRINIQSIKHMICADSFIQVQIRTPMYKPTDKCTHMHTRLQQIGAKIIDGITDTHMHPQFTLHTHM